MSVKTVKYVNKTEAMDNKNLNPTLHGEMADKLKRVLDECTFSQLVKDIVYQNRLEFLCKFHHFTFVEFAQEPLDNGTFDSIGEAVFQDMCSRFAGPYLYEMLREHQTQEELGK